jgi:predicted O-methyltransferase YrrM
MLDETIVTVLEQKRTDIKDHLRTLYNLVVDNSFRYVVELGAGQSTFVLSAAVNKTNGHLTSIDNYPDAFLRNNSGMEKYLPELTGITTIIKDDLLASTDVGNNIDLLFIDSDHSYSHVLETLRIWAPKVRSWGEIVLHDTDHDFGHAMGVLPALENYLSENPGMYTVQHIKGCGGLSILSKIEKI